jgi:hypothetical protein
MTALQACPACRTGVIARRGDPLCLTCMKAAGEMPRSVITSSGSWSSSHQPTGVRLFGRHGDAQAVRLMSALGGGCAVYGAASVLASPA